MKIEEILELKVDELEAMSDEALEKLLGPLIPQVRKAEPKKADLQKNQELLNQAMKMFFS